MLRIKTWHSGLITLALLLAWANAYSLSEFEQWKQQQQQSFQEYRDERDREFTAFLKEHWREVELLKGFVRDEKPKPDVMPVAKPQPAEPVPAPDTEPEELPEHRMPPEPALPLPEVREPEPPPVPPSAPLPERVQKGVRTQFDYFGTRITFYYDPAFRRPLPRRVDESALSAFWSELSTADYESLLQQLSAQADALRLDDWGTVVLVNRLAQQIYPSSANSQSLFAWFVLTKAGFSSRVAFNDYSVFLLLPSRQRLFDVAYFTFEGERYYAVSLDGTIDRPGSVYTYDGHYPGADKKLDMLISTRAAAGARAETRELSFEYAGKRYTIDASYEPSRIDFLGTYPQMELALYFRSEVGETAESPLLHQLAGEIEGMAELDAVNFLLRFVQTSFVYQTDDRQFGRENFLFPEETLFYPYSDCEDRSVLFAWLVNRLLGLDVVGLDYPGHVATAVRFNGRVEGDSVSYNGKVYTVADPTYVNATAGMTMPGFGHAAPKVIPVN